MENLSETTLDVESLSAALLDRLFDAPTDVLLRRPLRHFATSAGLEVNIPGRPSTDLFLRIMSDEVSLRAALRRTFEKAGSPALLKSFENYVRRSHSTSEKTKSRLGQALAMPVDTLQGFVHGNPNGPLVPAYVDMVTAVEQVFHTLGGANLRHAYCPLCRGFLIPETFWASGEIRLDKPAAMFVDRVLLLLAGVRSTRPYALDTVCADEQAAEKAPIGIWLTSLQITCGFGNRLEWEGQLAKRGMPPDRSGMITRERLNKWACGEDWMPLETAEWLCAPLLDRQQWITRLKVNRALVMVHEFVLATAEEEVDVLDARRAVWRRLQHIVNASRRGDAVARHKTQHG